jgi:hypothetical protein
MVMCAVQAPASELGIMANAFFIAVRAVFFFFFSEW